MDGKTRFVDEQTLMLMCMFRLESSIKMLQDKIKVYDETVSQLAGLVDASTGGAAINILKTFAVKMNEIGHNHIVNIESEKEMHHGR